jgi:metallo-beta-lactamase family protein
MQLTFLGATQTDADEVIAWLRQLRTAPRHVFVTHGEPRASDALRQRLQSELGWTASVPEYRDEAELAKE